MSRESQRGSRSGSSTIRGEQHVLELRPVGGAGAGSGRPHSYPSGCLQCVTYLICLRRPSTLRRGKRGRLQACRSPRAVTVISVGLESTAGRPSPCLPRFVPRWQHRSESVQNLANLNRFLRRNTPYYEILSITNAGKRLRDCLWSGELQLQPGYLLIHTREGRL